MNTRATTKHYRVVKGYGQATKVMEQMELDTDAEALEWVGRRWPNEVNAKPYAEVRLQRLHTDGFWRGVR